MSIDLVIQMYQGFHFEGELRMMNRLCDSIHEGVIVSIGSYRGQMDCALAMHAHVPVYAIDDRSGSIGEATPFSDQDRVEWMQNVLRMNVAAKIRPINLKSLQVAAVWDKPISLLFIDGSHDYESVRDDLRGFLPYVLTGGLIAFHDANTEGVMQAIADFRDGLEDVEQSDITCVFRNKYHSEQGAMSDWVGKAAALPGNVIRRDVPLLGEPIPAFVEGTEPVIGSGLKAPISFDDYPETTFKDAIPPAKVTAPARHTSQKPKTPPKKGTKK